MRLIDRRKYIKKAPFRDATLFVLVCEGEVTEPEYFKFFDRLTKKVKVEVVPSRDGKSSPRHLFDNAREAADRIKTGGDYWLWIILDTDRWGQQIRELQKLIRDQPNWKTALSNPCFEVWLFNHFDSLIPPSQRNEKCKTWKQTLGEQLPGGFEPERHPSYLKQAIQKSKENYIATGDVPEIGCTQVFELGEQLYELCKTVLEESESE